MSEDKIIFINNFLDSEFACSLSRWNFEVSDEEHKKKYFKYKSHFYSNVESGGRYDRSPDFFLNKSNDTVSMTLGEIRRRILFMVSAYRDYELGDNLSSKVINESELYRFYVSNDSIFGSEFSSIKDCFYAAETNEGFKIVYKTSFRDGMWNHSLQEDEQVQKLGKAIEVIRIQEPIDPISKEMYYSETDHPFNPVHR